MRSTRADTVASLLGNFTINQYCGLEIGAHEVAVHYAVIFGQLPALRELHVADADGNGVTTQLERDAYVASLAHKLAADLHLSVDAAPLPLEILRSTSSLPTEQGGFSLRVDVDLAAELPGVAGRIRALRFDNQNYAGRIGWHEIAVRTADGIAAFDTNAYLNSLTGGLTEALQALPATGPLDERSVHLRFTAGPAPTDAVLLAARPDSAAPNAARLPAGRASKSRGEAAWIKLKTRELVDAISAPRLSLHVIVATLLGALVLGAVHALAPGHGKTIVGAYLIGSRGTPRHAVFLGTTVTITHTLGVFILGFATLYASRFIVPERLFPALSLLSALLVLGMGVVLLMQRGRAARASFRAARNGGPLEFRAVDPVSSGTAARGSLVMAPAFGPFHLQLRQPAHAHGDATLHSHGGGPLHSHLPPGAGGEQVTWRSLLTLGISGGLVPCPSAMVLLLAAVAMNKTAYGMVLVAAFSAGLAITLTLVGLAFLFARNRLGRRPAAARWPLLLPVASAAAIIVLGLVLCYGAFSEFNQSALSIL